MQNELRKQYVGSCWGSHTLDGIKHTFLLKRIGVMDEIRMISMSICFLLHLWNTLLPLLLITLRPRLKRRPLADDIFKCIFLNENERISPKISLKFVPKVRINNIPALVQIMAWRRPGDKPLSESMMVNLLTHICVTRPQWVNRLTIWHPY